MSANIVLDLAFRVLGMKSLQVYIEIRRILYIQVGFLIESNSF